MKRVASEPATCLVVTLLKNEVVFDFTAIMTARHDFWVEILFSHPTLISIILADVRIARASIFFHPTRRFALVGSREQRKGDVMAR